MLLTGIGNIRRRVQTKTVDVKLPHPVACIVDQKLSHVLTMRTVDVEGLSPVVAVALRKIPIAEARQRITDRTDMVVDHIQNDRHAERMGGVDKSFECGSVAVT